MSVQIAYAGQPEFLNPGDDYGYDKLGEQEHGAKLGDAVIVGEPDEMRTLGRSLIDRMDEVAPIEPADVAGPAQQLSFERGWSYDALTSLAYDFLQERADNVTREAFLTFLRDAAEAENDDDTAEDASPDVDEPREG